MFDAKENKRLGSAKSSGTTSERHRYGEKWHDCPFRHQQEADEYCEGMNRCKVGFVKVSTEFSKGKSSELDAARRCAIWPDATHEDLMAACLWEWLNARHPALHSEFRQAIESLEFVR
jgi:hypothetical protein